MDEETPDPLIGLAESMMDQKWMEGIEWFEQSNWEGGMLDRFFMVMQLPEDEFRKQATNLEIECVQRLAYIAMCEIMCRSGKRRGEDE